MSVTQTQQPDLAAVKGRQRQTWASGDYSAVAARIVPMAEKLVEAADLQAGQRVLDVACGNGNAALAAARCGCEVTGIDYVPELLERGRARAAAEGLEVEFAEGDAEGLRFPDGAFDAVLSVVGVMFTPDQERAAAELARVCRPGGTIAVANWTPTSFVGQIFRTVTRYVPAPAGVRPPGLWGTEERLRELLGPAVSRLEITPRQFVFRFRSPDEFVDFFRTTYGPVHRPSWPWTNRTASASTPTWPPWPRGSTAARGRRWPCPPTTWRPSPCATRDYRGSAARIRSVLAGADDLLDGPAVAVGVGEEDEAAPGEVLDLAGLDAAVEELGAGGVDVGDDQLETGHRAGLGVREAGAQGDRAGRAGRGELDKAEVVADLVVVVGVEADLLGVEPLGPVHVADGDRDQLELPVHGRPLAGWGGHAATTLPPVADRRRVSPAGPGGRRGSSPRW